MEAVEAETAGSRAARGRREVIQPHSQHTYPTGQSASPRGGVTLNWVNGLVARGSLKVGVHGNNRLYSRIRAGDLEAEAVRVVPHGGVPV